LAAQTPPRPIDAPIGRGSHSRELLPVRATHIVTTLAFVGPKSARIVPAVEPIAVERAVVSPSATGILAKVTAVRAKAHEVAVAPIAPNGMAVTYETAAITPDITPVVPDVARVGANVATVRPDIPRVVPHFMSGRRHRRLGRNGGSKAKCHRGAKRPYS
jgi:hypothetical protein